MRLRSMRRAAGRKGEEFLSREQLRKKWRDELQGKGARLVSKKEEADPKKLRAARQKINKASKELRRELASIEPKKHPADRLILEIFSRAPIDEFGKKFKSLTELRWAAEGSGYSTEVLVARIHMLAAADYFGERIGVPKKVRAAPIRSGLPSRSKPGRKPNAPPNDLTFGDKHVRRVIFVPSSFPQNQTTQNMSRSLQSSPARLPAAAPVKQQPAKIISPKNPPKSVKRTHRDKNVREIRRIFG